MDPVFDTTAWVIETLLIAVALVAALPVLRTVSAILLLVLARATGQRQSRVHQAGVRLLPAFLRTAFGLTAGLSVLAGTAAAAAPPTPRIVFDRVITIEDPSALPTPSPAAAKPVATPTAPTADLAPAVAEQQYRVLPGDSLWQIARGQLVAHGSTPSFSQIDEAWRELWHANQQVIGDDPSLIRPGQLLTVPSDFGSR